MTITTLTPFEEVKAPVEYFPTYPKINTLWKRDSKNRVITGDYASREFRDLHLASWVWTEKIDGTNIRLGWDGYSFVVGGRTNNAVFNKPVIDALYGVCEQITPRMRKLYPGQFVVIYGEGYGAGVQKGGGYRSTPGFIAFDAMVGDIYGFPANTPMLSGRKFSELMDEFGLDRVSVLATCSIDTAWSWMLNREIYGTFPDVPLEGIVGRPENGYYKRNGDVLAPIICKMKYRDISDLNK